MSGAASKNHRLRVLVSPKTIVLSSVAGILVGHLRPSLGPKVATFAALYLALLQMCVLPILITAIVSGLGRLFSSGEAMTYLRKLIIVFALGIFLATLLGMITGMVGNPGGALKDSSQNAVGNILAEQESRNSSIASSEPPSMLGFVRMMIPINPFEAATQGKNLPVIFFCILLGMALGLLRTTSSETTLRVIESLFDALLKMIGWVMYGLPFGLFCMFTMQVSRTGLGIFFAMGRLLLCVYIGSSILLISYILIISRATRKSIRATLSALKEPIVVALGTSSSFATVPVSIVALEDKLKIQPNLSKLVVPIGVSLNPQGSVLYFSLGSMFMTQLYGLHLNLQGYLIVLFGSILSGMSVTGVPAAAALSVLSIVLDPLRLPMEIAHILFLAIDPFTDPILTCVNVLSGCAATAVIAEKTD